MLRGGIGVSLANKKGNERAIKEKCKRTGKWHNRGDLRARMPHTRKGIVPSTEFKETATAFQRVSGTTLGHSEQVFTIPRRILSLNNAVHRLERRVAPILNSNPQTPTVNLQSTVCIILKNPPKPPPLLTPNTTTYTKTIW